eukprot:gene10527-2654_t
MGITAVVITVRMGVLAHDAAVGRFNKSDENVHITDLNKIEFAHLSRKLSEVTSKQLAIICDGIVPKSGNYIRQHHVTAETVCVLREALGSTSFARTDAAQILALLHE